MTNIPFNLLRFSVPPLIFFIPLITITVIQFDFKIVKDVGTALGELGVIFIGLGAIIALGFLISSIPVVLYNSGAKCLRFLSLIYEPENLLSTWEKRAGRNGYVISKLDRQQEMNILGANSCYALLLSVPFLILLDIFGPSKSKVELIIGFYLIIAIFLFILGFNAYSARNRIKGIDDELKKDRPN